MNSKYSFVIAMNLLFSIPAFSFQISPCLRVLTYSPGSLGQKAIREVNKCATITKITGLAVHEHLTNLSIGEYRNAGFVQAYLLKNNKNKFALQQLNYRYPNINWYVGKKRKEHNTSNLIYGTWWNDDPLMLLWGQGSDIRSGAMRFRNFFSEKTQDKYPGGRLKCNVDRSESFGWNTHYGNLQYLHFMSNSSGDVNLSTSLTETKKQAENWIKFAYSVASSESGYMYNDKLKTSDLKTLGLPSLKENLCLNDSNNITVRTLFSRHDFPDERRKNMVPDIALGSILHVMQDSFSPAHTCRIKVLRNHEYYAVLARIYNYNEQKNEKDKHTFLDRYPSWLLDYTRTGTHEYANDPIILGAWVIKAIDDGLEWDKVKAHLDETIFSMELTDEEKKGKCIGSELSLDDTKKS